MTKLKFPIGSKPSDQSKRTTKSHDLSVTLQRIKVSKEAESAGKADPSRKRKASQTDEGPSGKKSPVAAEKERRPSPDTTTSNITTRKPAKAASDEVRIFVEGVTASVECFIIVNIFRLFEDRIVIFLFCRPGNKNLSQNPKK